MKRHTRTLIHVLCLVLAAPVLAGEYAVVVSKATRADKDWQPVVAALVKKHEAIVIEHDGEVAAALGSLRAAFPRYTCFVATPKEATGVYVAQVLSLIHI